MLALRALGEEAVGVAPDAEERLLHGVLRERLVAQDPQGEPVGDAAEAVVELGQRVVVGAPRRARAAPRRRAARGRATRRAGGGGTVSTVTRPPRWRRAAWCVGRSTPPERSSVTATTEPRRDGPLDPTSTAVAPGEEPGALRRRRRGSPRPRRSCRSGAGGTVSAIAASPSGATASAPRSPIGTSCRAGLGEHARRERVARRSGACAVQTPTPIATAAATAAAAASGAVQLRGAPAARRRSRRSLRACSRIRSLQLGRRSRPAAP